MHTKLAGDARQSIFSSIREALQAQPASEAADQGWSAIPRNYRRSPTTPASEVLALFIHRLRDYEAQVVLSTTENLSATIRDTLSNRGSHKLLLPAGFPAELLPSGFEFIAESGPAGVPLTYAQLDQCDGVLTQSTLAIAETGTIVLQNTPGQGRRATSLIPDYHLCLVAANCVKATVPEAMGALQPTARLPTTFISGPSATADIEMTRIKGVHGPRFLDVILISG